MDSSLSVIFFRSPGGREPVRDWLMDLSVEDRKRVSVDIRTVQFGWPVGMPVCRPLKNGLWEVRTRISHGRITRVIFFIHADVVYLLHGFIKKTQATPKSDLELASKRMNNIRKGLS